MHLTTDNRWREVGTAVRSQRWRVLALAGLLTLPCGIRVSAQDSTTGTPFGALRRGEIEIVLRNRTLVIPERIVSGLTIQPTLGLRWLMSDAIRLTLDAQTVDNSGPGRQGTYLASRIVPGAGSGNFLQEIAVEASASLARNGLGTRRLMASASLSRGVRSYFAHDSAAGTSFGGNRRRLVPTFELGGYQHFPRGEASLSVVSIFLSDDDALYLRAIPDDPTRFGTVIGPQLSSTVNLTGTLSAWGRVFAPVAGRNTINRTTGRPARAPAFDAGMRLGLNPAMDIELFVSNALGNTGALSFIPDREYESIGAGVILRPSKRFEVPRDIMRAEGRRSTEDRAPDATTGASRTALAPLAPPSRHAFLRLRGSHEAISAAIEYALVEHFSLGAFLDYPREVIDEGELGVLARMTLMDERDGAPVTVGAIAAASRTNNPLINLLTGKRDELVRRGLGRGGFHFGDEDSEEGRLYVIAVALPIERRIDARLSARLSPVVGLVQRNGVQLQGGVAGATYRLSPSWLLDGEVGATTGGKGNTLTRSGRSHAIPFGVSLAWRSSAFSNAVDASSFSLEAFLTNRVGDSPFHSLRVLADHAVAAGVGVRLLLR